MTNLYKITVKNTYPSYDCYNGFIVIGDSITDALETIYSHICKDFEDNEQVFYKDIPYYLRSSNLNIENIGKVELDKKIKDKILMIDYENA